MTLAASGEVYRRPLSILIYHRVLSEPDFMRPGEPTLEQFTWQMQLLRRYFNVLPLVEAARALEEGCLPPRAVAITFDDGYADNATLAMPVLQRLGLPATVFVASHFLNGGRMWNDTIIETCRQATSGALDLSSFGLPPVHLDDRISRRKAAEQVIQFGKYLSSDVRGRLADEVARHAKALPDDLMLTTRQLQSLPVGGLAVGGHTDSHPILACLGSDEASREIAKGKQRLESLIDQPVTAFAYPNGRPGKDYARVHVEQVRAAGFTVAVSTKVGVAAKGTDCLQLPRFTPWDRTVPRYLARMAIVRKRIVRE